MQSIPIHLHVYKIQVLSSAMVKFPVQYLPLLLGDESKVSLLRLGALEPLCQLITHNNKLVRRTAFMALGTMATNGVSDNIQYDKCSLLRDLMTHHATYAY